MFGSTTAAKTIDRELFNVSQILSGLLIAIALILANVTEAVSADSVRTPTSSPVPVGAAIVDITPDYPVRLTGYGNRTAEASEAATAIHARAIAIGSDEHPGGPAVLITVDNCGVTDEVTEVVCNALIQQHGLKRSSIAICSTHTHSGPWLMDFAPGILLNLPDAHRQHLAQYEKDLIESLKSVAAKALKARRPASLSIARGSANFAINRRSLSNGQWAGFGTVPDGPVDHQLPILAAHDEQGDLIAVMANYACHATTETGSFNQVSGDWPGFAADYVEQQYPEAVALMVIGCGADANPEPRGTHEQAKKHGRTVADEVTRLLEMTQPLSSKLKTKLARIDLPLGPLPSKEQWEQLAGRSDHAGARARRILERLNAGIPVPDVVPDYPVQTWCFGDDLAMVFLGGEVVVDYAIRLNEMLDSDRLWVNAYCNDVPCYIPSRRILREGGYEADQSMVYYDRPTRLAPETEDLICDTVQKLLPQHFYSKDLQSEFPAPKDPSSALKTIQVPEGFRVELVAAEPLIRDPVAFDWDAAGRLWVVEMGGYPNGVDDGNSDSEPRRTNGRIRVLVDQNGDGQYDSATTFLECDSFPTSICAWRDGVIFTSAPDVIYAVDQDGDLQADRQQVLFTGFAEGNQQHRINGLRMGLDGWLYLANGDSGGSISAIGSILHGDFSAPQKQKAIRGQDVRIQPDTGELEMLSGQTQCVRSRDDFGNWLGNNNSNPIWHYLIEDRYLKRNPHARGIQTRAQVAEVPGAAPVYPISSTLSRFNDFDRANRFTSACSTSVYRDSRFGDDLYGDAFICEPVHNLVSRLDLSRSAESFTGKRVSGERQSEFLASTDNWFRPVMVRTGPDGCIYVADMYRCVIEHPQWIPAEYQRKLNLRSGDQQGRIYRIVPNADPVVTHPKEEWLTTESRKDPKTLVDRLESSNGWWRDTAQRLLLHSSHTPESSQLIQNLLHHDLPSVRTQAMHTLALLSPEQQKIQQDLIQAISDENPEVRRQAIRLLEPSIQASPTLIIPQLTNLAADPDISVRHQLALSLGETQHPIIAGPLAVLIRNNQTHQSVVDAAITSLSQPTVQAVVSELSMKSEELRTSTVIRLLAQATAFGSTDALDQLGAPMIRQASHQSSTDALSNAHWSDATLLLESVHQRPDHQSDSRWQAELDSAGTAAQNLVRSTQSSSKARSAAMKFLVAYFKRIPSDDAASLLTDILRPATASEILVDAAPLMAANRSSSDIGFSKWKSLTPTVRDAFCEALLQQKEGPTWLLHNIETEIVTANELSAACADQLLHHRNQQIRETARSLLRQTSSTQTIDTINELQRALEELRGNPGRGRGLFQKHCSVCHRLDEIGSSIGADLGAFQDRSTLAMLTAILDPNRAVESRFLSFTAVTHDGLTRTGILTAETSTTVTLVTTGGQRHEIARADLEELVCTNRSLMPEGLQKNLTAQELADVIAFIQNAEATTPANFAAPQIVIQPETDGTIILPASAAAMSGPSIKLESKYGNLGWWCSTKDVAVWSMTVPKSGHWKVELEYACDNSTAGNLIKFSTGTRLLSGRVPGSGSWDNYTTWTVGTIDLRQGLQQLTVRAPHKPSQALIDLKTIRLTPSN